MKDNETALKMVHAGTSIIANSTISQAVDWIESKSFQVLREAMKTDDWQFVYPVGYDKLSGIALREIATDQMYEDANAVAETIDRVMKITIKLE